MFSEELMRFVSGSSCKDISFWGTWDVPWLIDEIFEASSKVSLEVADFLKELQMITRVYSHVNLKLSSKPQIHSLHWNDIFFWEDALILFIIIYVLLRPLWEHSREMLLSTIFQLSRRRWRVPYKTGCKEMHVCWFTQRWSDSCFV